MELTTVATFTAGSANGKAKDAAPAKEAPASGPVMVEVTVNGETFRVSPKLAAQLEAQEQARLAEIEALKAQQAGPAYPQYRIAAAGEATKSGEARRATTVYITLASGTRDIGHTAKVWVRILANAAALAHDFAGDPATFGCDDADVASLNAFLKSLK